MTTSSNHDGDNFCASTDRSKSQSSRTFASPSANESHGSKRQAKRSLTSVSDDDDDDFTSAKTLKTAKKANSRVTKNSAKLLDGNDEDRQLRLALELSKKEHLSQQNNIEIANEKENDEPKSDAGEYSVSASINESLTAGKVEVVLDLDRKATRKQQSKSNSKRTADDDGENKDEEGDEEFFEGESDGSEFEVEFDEEEEDADEEDEESDLSDDSFNDSPQKKRGRKATGSSKTPKATKTKSTVNGSKNAKNSVKPASKSKPTISKPLIAKSITPVASKSTITPSKAATGNLAAYPAPPCSSKLLTKSGSKPLSALIKPQEERRQSLTKLTPSNTTGVSGLSALQQQNRRRVVGLSRSTKITKPLHPQLQ